MERCYTSRRIATLLEQTITRSWSRIIQTQHLRTSLSTSKIARWITSMSTLNTTMTHLFLQNSKASKILAQQGPCKNFKKKYRLDSRKNKKRSRSKRKKRSALSCTPPMEKMLLSKLLSVSGKSAIKVSYKKSRRPVSTTARNLNQLTVSK